MKRARQDSTAALQLSTARVRETPEVAEEKIAFSLAEVIPYMDDKTATEAREWLVHKTSIPADEHARLINDLF